MKTKAFFQLLLLVFSSIFSIAQNEIVNPKHIYYPGCSSIQELTEIASRLDSNYYWNLDSLSNAFIPDRRGYFTYDSQQKPVGSLYQRWIGGEWIEENRYSYFYDENNKISEELFEYWNGSTWISGMKTLYLYDSINKISQMVFQKWNGFTWQSQNRSLYTFDSNNILIAYESQNLSESCWVNNLKEYYYYDANNYLTGYLVTSWLPSSQSWIEEAVYSKTNNSLGDLKFETEKQWNGSGWSITDQNIFTYNAKNNLTVTSNQHLHGTRLENSGRTLFAYDANDNNDSRVFQFWNSGIWQTVDSGHFYFSSITSGLSSENKILDLTIFPNPATRSFTIELSDFPDNEFKLTIHDITGRFVKEVLIDAYSDVLGINRNSIDIHELVPGVYTLNAQIDDKRYQAKLIVE